MHDPVGFLSEGRLTQNKEHFREGLTDLQLQIPSA